MKWFREFWRRWLAERAPAPKAKVPKPPKAAPVVPTSPVVAPLSLAAFTRIAEPAGFSPRDIVRAIAAGDAHKIDASGWVGLVDADGRLDISRAKRLGITMLDGLAGDDPAAVDRALAGIRGAMVFQGADGSFATQDFGAKQDFHSIHKKTIALCDWAHALHAAKASPFYIGARMVSIDALVARIGVTAVWLAGSDDLAGFFADTDGQCNQFLSAIGFLHAAGVLTGNLDLQGAARAKMEWVFANMVSGDGVFREKFKADGVGYDTVYQLFSMRLLACYVMMLPAGLWRDNCLGRLRQGLRRWVQTIDPATGLVDDSSSSRTTATNSSHQVASGSCSTQPGCGKICRNSRCAMATTLPRPSNTMLRELDVP